jgi:hypothetical protein
MKIKANIVIFIIGIRPTLLTFILLIDTTRDFIPSSIGDVIVAWFSLLSSSKVIVLDYVTSCTWILIARL